MQMHKTDFSPQIEAALELLEKGIEFSSPQRFAQALCRSYGAERLSPKLQQDIERSFKREHDSEVLAEILARCLGLTHSLTEQIRVHEFAAGWTMPDDAFRASPLSRCLISRCLSVLSPRQVNSSISEVSMGLTVCFVLGGSLMSMNIFDSKEIREVGLSAFSMWGNLPRFLPVCSINHSCRATLPPVIAERILSMAEEAGLRSENVGVFIRPQLDPIFEWHYFGLNVVTNRVDMFKLTDSLKDRSFEILFGRYLYTPSGFNFSSYYQDLVSSASPILGQAGILWAHVDDRNQRSRFLVGEQLATPALIRAVDAILQRYSP